MCRRNSWPSPFPLGCSLDQTGDVGQYELAPVDGDHAEVRNEGCERVIRDLRFRCRNARNERALPRVRETNQRAVSGELQLEMERPIVAVLPLFGERWRPPIRRDEGSIAAAPTPTLSDDETLARFDKVGNHQPILITNDRAERNNKLKVITVAPVPEFAFRMVAVTGLPVRLAIVSQECADSRVGDKDDIAAPPPVSSIRPTTRLALPLLE